MLKILQARLQQDVNHELPDAQAGFQRDRGTSIHRKLPIFMGPQRKQGSFTKTPFSASLTMLKSLCGSEQTVETS